MENLSDMTAGFGHGLALKYIIAEMGQILIGVQFGIAVSEHLGHWIKGI